jgi:hypothetical protein
MNKYRYEVTLFVEVEAFDEEDARVIVSDYLGSGPMGDVLEILRSDASEV